jgi:hypothetical protein
MPTIAPIACTAQIRRFSVVTFAALTLAASVSSGLAQRLDPSVRQRVTQNETAPSNAPTVPRSTTKTGPVRTPSPPEITKWQQSLVAHLGRFKRYPAKEGAAEGVSRFQSIERATSSAAGLRKPPDRPFSMPRRLPWLSAPRRFQRRRPRSPMPISHSCSRSGLPQNGVNR